ncbi:HU family DNA-binding protein [Oceanimonas pelagia]|uniref:HU family DNA-binding protein n=1 Tax=Oceanimonas pelagia TaxID=3028314 RepID=A0AA50KLC2_9GAMM|nr:HU family DNA-binding protein [Oceanimonas pelagia]WMC09559.1 HU family DNA-binding protein [Oceanimonas pelagia]
MTVMTKREIIVAMAEAADISQVKAKAALEKFLDLTANSLAHGESVALSPLGTLKPVATAARTYQGFGRETVVPAHYRVKFNPSQKLKEALKR